MLLVIFLALKSTTWMPIHPKYREFCRLLAAKRMVDCQITPVRFACGSSLSEFCMEGRTHHSTPRHATPQLYSHGVGSLPCLTQSLDCVWLED